MLATRVLPERNLDGDVAVNCYGQQAKDGTLRQHEDEACDEQTAVKITAKACADNDGEGDGEEAHGHIRCRQGNHKVIGDALEIAVEADSPAHQHISSHGQQSNQQLQADVEGVFTSIHAGCFTAGVVWDCNLPVALIAGPRSSRVKDEDSLSKRAEEASTLLPYTVHAVSFTPV